MLQSLLDRTVLVGLCVADGSFGGVLDDFVVLESASKEEDWRHERVKAKREHAFN